MDSSDLNPGGLLKLLQLISPSLPVGAFSYSQGIEWTVEAGWISTPASLQQWLSEQLSGTMAQQELPLLLQLYQACESKDQQACEYWSNQVLAFRETAELRDEERKRGRAMSMVLEAVGGDGIPATCQSAAFASYCVQKNIECKLALYGFAYAWLDNQIMAGIKLVPLGQTDGQRILNALLDEIERSVSRALSIEKDEIGYSSPALAMASSWHETQYCRLYRS